MTSCSLRLSQKPNSLTQISFNSFGPNPSIRAHKLRSNFKGRRIGLAWPSELLTRSFPDSKLKLSNSRVENDLLKYWMSWIFLSTLSTRGLMTWPKIENWKKKSKNFFSNFKFIHVIIRPLYKKWKSIIFHFSINFFL